MNFVQTTNLLPTFIYQTQVNNCECLNMFQNDFINIRLKFYFLEKLQRQHWSPKFCYFFIMKIYSFLSIVYSPLLAVLWNDF